VGWGAHDTGMLRLRQPGAGVRINCISASVRPERSAEGAKSKDNGGVSTSRACASYAQRERYW